MKNSKKILVLGASGSIGNAVAKRFLQGGFKVFAMSRTKSGKDDFGVEWILGDAMNEDDVTNAAQNMGFIFHGVNPPNYQNWGKFSIPMLNNTIAAAKETGATILFPANVYNFGADVYSSIREDSPQNPATSKGKVRAELEVRLKSASDEGCKIILLRMGDFIGANSSSSWFTEGMVKKGSLIKSITNPCAKNTRHQWAYLPDAAEAFFQLALRANELENFASYNFEGFIVKGEDFAQAIRKILNRNDIKLVQMPWWIMSIGGIFNNFAREMAEMRYEFENEVLMDGTKLKMFLPELQKTHFEKALADTLAAYGCH